MDKKVNKQASPWFLSSRTTLKTPSRCWYAAKANERWRTNNPLLAQICSGDKERWGSYWRRYAAWLWD